MAEEPDKAPEKKPEAEKGVTMAQVLEHPMVQKMHAEITQLRQLMEGLPEAIGRAVIAAQEEQRPKGIDVSNPELLTGTPFSKEKVVVQNLQKELDKTRKDIGYVPMPLPVIKKPTEPKE